MKYKAMVFDLDGTAIPNGLNSQPSTRLITTIAGTRGQIKLCAATGRTMSNAKPIISRLGLTDLCVISAGAQIIDPSNWSVVWQTPIARPDVDMILEICRSYPNEILMGDELEGHGAPAATHSITEPVTVMYIMECSETRGAIIMERLLKIDGIAASAVMSWTGRGLDIHVTNRAATKEFAITKLLELLGVEKQGTIGIGDNNNDLHLFEAVGHRVAMGNATAALKAEADEICGDVTEDGLASYIDSLRAPRSPVQPEL
jgi:hydroxymethylpyrimidine pyrophosphatase-like HAD family hydrolase